MRYPLLDTIRGLASVSMILYHATWDIVFIFGHYMAWFEELPGFIWEQSICWTFILVSGFSQNLAKHGYRDGIIISASGLLVTLVSIIFQIGMEIYFGILTFMGLAVLILTASKKWLDKIQSTVATVIFSLLFLVTYNIRNGYFGFPGFKILVPEVFYDNSLGWLCNLIGFPQYNFTSGDYFPLIPWLFLFFVGYYVGRLFIERRAMKFFETGSIPVLDWIGRHSLIIYLIHQPVIYLILFMIYH